MATTTMTHSKQHALLHAYSAMIVDSDPYESDYAECAALLLATGGVSSTEKCIARILANAIEYMSSLAPGGSNTNASSFKSSASASAATRPTGGSKRSMRASNDSFPLLPAFTDSSVTEVDEQTQTYNMSDDNTILNVYAEGTSINIGTSNAASGCGIYSRYIRDDFSVKEWKKSFLLSREEPASNQRAELRSFFAALDAIERIKAANPHINAFNLHITSKYALNCATEWGRTWSANRWKRVEGPIKNVDIIRPLYEKLEQMPYVSVSVFQREKKAGTGAGAAAAQEIPAGFIYARKLAIDALNGTRVQSTTNP